MASGFAIAMATITISSSGVKMTPVALLMQSEKLPESCNLSIYDILWKTGVKHEFSEESLKDIFWQVLHESKSLLSKKAYELCVKVYQFNAVDFFISAGNHSYQLYLAKKEKEKELKDFFNMRGWIEKNIDVNILVDSKDVLKPIYKNHRLVGYKPELIKVKPYVTKQTLPFFVRKVIKQDGMIYESNVLNGLNDNKYMLIKGVYHKSKENEEVENPEFFYFDTFEELKGAL